MAKRQWSLALGLSLLIASSADAQVTSGVLNVTQCEMS